MKKKVTMLDIANIAGVSKATVSMVINRKDEHISEETRNKVLKVADELDFIPDSVARSLATNKSGTIGIILPDITNPFFSEMARAIEDEANNCGFNVIFCNSDNEIKKEKKYVELLISKRVDGVIFIAGGKSSGNIEILNSKGTPFVIVDRYCEEHNEYYGVYCRSREGVENGIEYLYSIGKRKIAFVTGQKGLEISRQRLAGYRYACKKRGIYNKEYVFQGDYTLEGGIKATEAILKFPEKFDTIFYSSDIAAFGGMKTLLRHGYKIPEDIGIMGFDNIKISQFIEPELTTIAQPIYEMGTESVKLLVKIISGDNVTQKQIFFKPQLVVRGTVKP